MMEYILLTNEDIINLNNGNEVYCSLNGNSFAIMLDQAFRETYLGTKTTEETDNG